jgi:hypothetical protein
MPDSPFACLLVGCFGQWSEKVGAIVVLMFTLWVHAYDRHLHRQTISREMPTLARSTSIDLSGLSQKNSAREKTEAVSRCLEAIDAPVIPSTVRNFFALRRVSEFERTILSTLRNATQQELNYVLTHVKLGLLCYKVKDQSESMNHRTQIIELIAKTRLADLTVASRVAFIDAMQVMRISANEKCASLVKHVILNTTGDDLTQLKCLTDSKGDVHSFHKLLYEDIQDPTFRGQIVEHIQRCANIQNAHMKIGTRIGKQNQQLPWLKILSDVDDTLFSSGGHFPAGIDSSYPHHIVYPGITGFYRELDLGVEGEDFTSVDKWPRARMGNLAFLSVRDRPSNC